MTLNTKKAVPKELIDSLLADYKKPEDLIGENGLLKQLSKLIVERALDAEMCRANIIVEMPTDYGQSLTCWSLIATQHEPTEGGEHKCQQKPSLQMAQLSL